MITVRYIPFPGGKNWMNKPLVVKEKTFKTEAQMEALLEKLDSEGNLKEVLGYSKDNPGYDEIYICRKCGNKYYDVMARLCPKGGKHVPVKGGKREEMPNPLRNPLGEFYADYDRESGSWCVFHTDRKPGFAYASYADEREAEKAAKEMNKNADIAERLSGNMILGGPSKTQAREIIKRLTGKVVKSNPGAAWHKEKQDRYRNARIEAEKRGDSSTAQLFSGMNLANIEASLVSEQRGLPNPRPPTEWWVRMYPRVKATYPRLGAKRLQQITAGIWYGYGQKTRKELIKRYG